MKMMMAVWSRVVAGGAALLLCGSVHANLLVNPGFDSDLSGWTIDPITTTGVTWITGTAHIGRPGPSGVAVFEQSFDILAGTDSLGISFDYQWQTGTPDTPDFFGVELTYASTSGAVTELLLSESSAGVSFNAPLVYGGAISLVDLVAGPGNGTVRFMLAELDNTRVGTRIQLDNVVVAPRAVVNPVPVPGTLFLLGLGLVALSRLPGGRKS